MAKTLKALSERLMNGAGAAPETALAALIGAVPSRREDDLAQIVSQGTGLSSEETREALAWLRMKGFLEVTR
jgi:hypothetical protein